MLTANDVAGLFLVAESKKEHSSMTNLRLNKMLYFAQIFSMLELNEPLFQDNIEAWTLGPVIRPVYYRYKPYERAPITETIEPNFNCFTVVRMMSEDKGKAVTAYYTDHLSEETVNVEDVKYNEEKARKRKQTP